MLSFVTLASAVTIAVANGPVASWPMVSSNDGKFTVRMPGPVDEKLNKVTTDVALLDVHTFTCQAGTAFYQVSFVDLPKKMLAATTPEDMLLSAQAGARSVSKTLVFSEGNGTTKGSSWRRYRVEVPRGPVVAHYLQLTGSRLYHLEVVAPPKNWRRAKPKDFFDSFSVEPD